jgi:hypothetical protein
VAYKNHATLNQSSALALATGLMLASSPAQAQSFQGESFIVEGSATVTIGVDTTDVSVETDSAVIDWVPFDDSGIGDIFFQDPGTTATFTNGTGITNFAVLNRILPIDPTSRIILNGNIVSQIQDGMGGSVTGGTVFFYTPGGIIIGANAVIDVGNLGLTTSAPLTDGNGNFIIGDTVDFQQSDGFSDITIEQGAQINALQEGSYVALFAPRIVQDGDIAVNGQAAFVAAEAGTITFSPDGLFDIQVDVGTDAGFGAIEHSGSTGGPASTGAGDNHRIYMVAVAKNTAATLLIQGGSELGFDIATSASMDGEAIVLSGGYNITVGDIGPQATSGAETDVLLVDSGFANGLTATSDVLVRADGLASGSFTDVALFEGDLDLASGRSAVVTNGSAALLTVGGNLSIVSDTPNAGQDVGISDMRLRNGSTANIAGDLFVASTALGDGNGNNLIQGSTASVSVNEASTLTVNGNLTIDSGADLSADLVNGFQVNSGVARLLVSSGFVTVGGVTRVRSDTIAGAGGNVFTGAALVSVSGGFLITDELSISTDAFGGVDDGAGGGNATSGTASLITTGGGNFVTVLSGNTIGDPVLGELDFLSGDAFGGEGTIGDGGAATSGTLELIVEDGATITLPDEIANPLLLSTSAIAGDTAANGGAGGVGATGQVVIRVTDSTANLGRLAIRSTAMGGSALPGSVMTSGGNAGGGFTILDFDNADVTAAFDEIRIEHLAGAGSADGLGTDGVANGSNVMIDLDGSTFNVLSDLVVTGLALDGDGSPGFGIPLDIVSSGGEFNVGGNLSATGAAVNFTVDDGAGAFAPGTVQIDGDLLLESVTARFGGDADSAALNVTSGTMVTIGGNVLISANASADSNNDGTINGGSVGLLVEGAGTNLVVGGNAVLDASIDLTGGPTGLNARGGNVDLSVTQGAVADIGGVTRLTSNAIGAVDGNATGEFILLSVLDGSQLTTGELSLSSDATGGEGVGGAGGNANAGTVQLNVNGGGSTLNVLGANTIGDPALGELEFLSSEAFGGHGLAGAGGAAIAGSTNINIEAGAVVNLANVVGNPLMIVNTAIGGDTSADDASAGEATSGFNRFVITDSTANLGRLSNIVNIVGGSAIGASQRSFGGGVLMDFNEFLIINSNVDAAFDQILFTAVGGSGSSDGLGFDGSIITGNYTVNVENSTFDILSDFAITATGTQGNGQLTNSQNLLIGFSGSDVSVAGDIDLSASRVNMSASLNLDSGNVTTLDVTGGILMTANGPAFGNDVGLSDLAINGGSIVNVGADVLLSARANGDANGDGEEAGGDARLTVQDLGSSLAVGGDLVLDVGADLSGNSTGVTAQGGFAEVLVLNAGQVSIDGVTRLLNNAIAGDSGSATAGEVRLSVFSGGVFSTGELNMSVDAFGGADVGAGSGDATAGTISITSADDDSSITVLNANVTGDAALGELDFLSSEAVGGLGINVGGGAAATGSVTISVRDGGVISLPNAAGNPLLVINSATGGDTEASDSFGGSAQTGDTFIDVNGGVSNLGNLSIIARSLGGSAVGGAERSSGGNANGGFVRFGLFNADVDVAFEQFLVEQIGGNGSTDGLGIGGSAFGSDISFNVQASTLDVLSSVNIIGLTRGGDGQSGGFANAATSAPFLEGSVINIAGDFTIAMSAQGGAALGTGMVTGGDAQTQFTGMQLRNVQITASGDIAVGSAAIGGDAAEGTAGSAIAGEVFVGLFAGTTVDATAYRATSTATGGSILAGGVGNGGNADSGNSTLSYDDSVTDGVVTLTGDVFNSSMATGGSAGENGGDGGAATSGSSELRTFSPGQINIGGSTTALARATGGNSSLGLGGASQSGNASLTGSEGQINIAGDASLITQSTGGNGQIGGDAANASVLLRATGRGIAVAGEASLIAQASGGNGVDNNSTSDGGTANGGSATVDARNNAGGTPTLISLGGLDVSVSATGGTAGTTSGGEDGGRGGNAMGGTAFVFGRAINGTLEVIGDTNLEVVSSGGFGGTGAIGGSGGDALGGGIQFGTASGGAVPDQVDGAATFADVNAEVLNFGGNGGQGTTGLGGDGGDARGGFVTMLVRGATVTANDVELTTLSLGGTSGSGFGLGEGGDAVAGALSLVVSQAFQNPGRGQLNLGSLLLEATVNGGFGGEVGASQYSTGGEINIRQADATIGSIEVNIEGDSEPDFLVEDFVNGGMIPVTVNPFLIAFENGTLNVDTVDVMTAGEVNLVAGGSTVTSRLFDITAGSFFQPDPSDPPLPAGSINAAERLVLASTAGDVATQATLTSGDQLTLDSAASVVVGDLTAPNIFLSAPAGDVITGLVDSGGGSVSIQSGNPIDLGSIVAESLTAISTGGDITSSGVITLTGALMLDAAGSVLLNEVTAGSISATAQSGDIVFSGTVVSAGDIVLDAAGLIQLATTTAASIDANSRGGDIISDEPLEADGLINLNASGSVQLADVTADTLNVSSGQFASVNLGGQTNVAGALQIGSGGSIELAEVTAGSVDATALDGNITATNTLNVMGLLDLDAVGSIELANVTAGSLTASTQVGDVTGLDPIVVAGALDINAASNLGLGDVTAGAITVQAGDVAQVNGLWQAELVNITSSTLQIMGQALIDAGTDGTINLTSTNDLGVLLTDTDASGIERFVVDTDALARLQTGQLVISGAANLGGSDIEIGDIDLSSNAVLNDLTIQTTDPLGDIRVVGNVTASAGNPLNLSFAAGQFQIDSTAGSVDLLSNGGTIAISANSIAIGEAALFDALTGDETAQELFDLLSAPAATTRPDGVLNGSALTLNATDRILVQNTGTAELAAGLVITSGETISIGPDGLGSENLLFVINAQINDGAGNVLTGDDAATAILESLPADAVFAAGSRFNGCELGGCGAVAAATDQGEITSTVSAAISGTGSSSGSGGTGGTSGSDGGADSGGADEGSSDGAEDASSSGSGANAGSGSSGNSGGGDVSVDDIDDGGGNDDFAIDDGESGGGSDEGGGDDTGDDTGADDSDDSSDEGDSEAEENEADDSEDSEETDEEEAEEEEEAAEEEEEESEEPTSGPIAPPVSIINTNTLDRRGAINDPISGSGNPALIDPDVDVSGDNGIGEQP